MGNWYASRCRFLKGGSLVHSQTRFPEKRTSTPSVPIPTQPKLSHRSQLVGSFYLRLPIGERGGTNAPDFCCHCNTTGSFSTKAWRELPGSLPTSWKIKCLHVPNWPLDCLTKPHLRQVGCRGFECACWENQLAGILGKQEGARIPRKENHVQI